MMYWFDDGCKESKMNPQLSLMPLAYSPDANSNNQLDDNNTMVYYHGGRNMLKACNFISQWWKMHDCVDVCWRSEMSNLKRGNNQTKPVIVLILPVKDPSKSVWGLLKARLEVFFLQVVIVSDCLLLGVRQYKIYCFATEVVGLGFTSIDSAPSWRKL